MDPKRVMAVLAEMGQTGARATGFARAAAADPALAAKLSAAVEAGDNRAILKLMADQTWTTAPARKAPQGPGRPPSRDPVSFEDRIAKNTGLRSGLEEIGVSTEGMTQEQVLEAVAEAFRKDVKPRKRPAKKAADPTRDPESPEYIPDVNAMGVREDAGGNMIDMAGFETRPSRQMELPLGDGPTGMVPFGVRGAGIPVGGVRGPGTPVGGMSSPGGGMIPAEPRGLSNPNALTPDNLLARLRGPDSLYRPSSTEVGRPRLPRLPDKRLSTNVELEGIPGPRPRVYQVPPRRLTGAVEEAVEDVPDFRFRDPVRTVDEFPPPARGAWKPLAAAALAGAAATAGKYIYDQFQNDNVASTDAEFTPMPAGGDSAIDSTDGAADLAAETSPPPVMETQEDPMDAPVDYSVEARKVIDDLNARRRAAGGEVPEAKEMMAEANRLLALGNQTRQATYAAAPQDDASRYFQQAQGLIDQVNQMYRQGMTPNSPEVRQVTAEVRRLQQMGDSLRNRRAG